MPRDRPHPATAALDAVTAGRFAASRDAWLQPPDEPMRGGPPAFLRLVSRGVSRSRSSSPALACCLLLLTACADGGLFTPDATSEAPDGTPAAAPSVPPRPEPQPSEAPDAARPGVGPVLLIGADALDLSVLRPLVRAGKVPNLARLLREGAHGVCYSEREIRSPALWTTVATGRPRQVHGIWDFVTGSRLWPPELRGGEKRLVTSSMRQAPALWQLVGDTRTVAVVGWLNTWPAEAVHGVMVAPYVALGQRKQITIKGTIYEDEPGQISPKDRWEEIAPLLVERSEVPDELFYRLIRPPPEEVLDAHPILRRYHEAARWSLAHTMTMERVARHLLETDRPDLTLVFFEGSDSLAHRFWLFRQPEAAVSAVFESLGWSTRYVPALREAYGDVVDHYYEILDEAIGRLLDAAPPDTTVIVVSDHGFGDRTGRFPLNPKVPFTGEHRIEGTILIHGPSIEPGSRIFGATLYDVAPTVLDLLGVETSVPFEGHSLVPTLVDHGEAEGGLEDHALDEDPRNVSLSSRYDEEEMKRLRSLGYVE